MAKRWMAFPLLAVFLLSTAMRCGKEEMPWDDYTYYWPIPEIGDAKAYVTISPVKETYSVGDTIVCMLRVDKKDCNSWSGFDRSVFEEFSLNLFDGKENGWSHPIPEKSKKNTEATVLSDEEAYVEQVSCYKLTSSGTFLIGSGFLYPHEAFQVFQFWTFRYDGHDGRHYQEEIPVYFKHTGKRGMLIKVEE